ncbi:protein nessun dorma [Drosophila grimshawi]|uniref:GH13238 n=1 Tax=Drosophila grimshawi TaxID=7222 RepID=B4JQ94_DROGR|nr:protein nessun dorma [Drosophila grimshawi]EDV99074.1 GH13238 [Drosophila grimshawi]
MDVYTFEKSFLERLKEAEAVLSWDGAAMPASQVCSEWKAYVELQIEPAGWQAMWKIPRVICEDLKLRYPTIVFGTVDQVMFDELKAVFTVTAVQDQDMHLPESNEVALIELWPTIQQENSALNVDTTAECIDRLRFFYTHVWMPWDKDSDGDRDWVQIHLQSRIQLACELSKHRLPRPLTLHMRTLLMEAHYIQQRLEYLELDMSDAEEDDDEELATDATSEKPKKQLGSSAANNLNKSILPVTDLMCLHLRLAIIRSEFEILENPDMRRAYSELQSNGLKRHLLQRSSPCSLGQLAVEQTQMCHLVTLPVELQTQIHLLTLAKQLVKPHTKVQLGNTLQDVLSICQANDDILLSPGQHNIKFLEHLNDNGSIQGLIDAESVMASENDNDDELRKLPVICSSDEDSTLLVIDGDYALSNLVLDCRHVRRGILLRCGTLTLRSCRLLGDGSSSTQEAIVCMPQAKLKLHDCRLENFAIGLSLRPETSAVLSNVNIRKCNTGLELLDKTTKLKLEGNNCNFQTCQLGILADGIALPNSSEKTLALKHFSELQRYNESNWLGNCAFHKCQRNVRIFNESQQLLAKRARQNFLMEDLDVENKENIN